MANPFAPIPTPSTQYPFRDSHDCLPGQSTAHIEQGYASPDAFGHSAYQSQYPYYPADLRFDQGLADHYLAAHPSYPDGAADYPYASTLSPAALFAPDATIHDPLHANGTDPFLNTPGSYADAPYTPTYPSATESSWNVQGFSYDPLLATAPSHSSHPGMSDTKSTFTAGQSCYSALANALSYSQPNSSARSQDAVMFSTSTHSPPEPLATQAYAPDPHSIAGGIYDAAPLVPPPPFIVHGHVAQGASSLPHSLASPSSSEASVPSPTVSKKRFSNSLRNTLASPTSPTSPTSATKSEDKWKCPYCGYVQHNHRTQELKRHVETTHERPQEKSKALWICCGVPLAQAAEKKVPLDLALSPPFEYNGVLFVGGCREDFSRPDALARHLRNNEGVCFGDRYGEYLLGNAKKAQGRSS